MQSGELLSKINDMNTITRMRAPQRSAYFEQEIANLAAASLSRAAPGAPSGTPPSPSAGPSYSTPAAAAGSTTWPGLGYDITVNFFVVQAGQVTNLVDSITSGATDAQIELQMRVLNEAFGPYGFVFKLGRVDRTSLTDQAGTYYGKFIDGWFLDLRDDASLASRLFPVRSVIWPDGKHHPTELNVVTNHLQGKVARAVGLEIFQN